MTAILLSVALLWGVAVVTPGPNFLVVSHAAVTASRRAALWAVAGLMLGTALWGSVGVLGIGVLFVAVPWTYLVFKVVGGLYLIWLGARLLWSARRAAPVGAPSGGAVPARPLAPGRALARGFVTVATNPKSGTFVASLFAAVLPPDPTAGLSVAMVATMVVVSGVWYGLVAWSLGHATPRRLYIRGRRTIEAAAGALFVLFGVRLLAAR
ncbi:LysE family transporter [Roseospira goensis]|uniref:Threonine/homoserine/homoserine lactone efflux protein n=1 Tax=Roseospira goensis TaxID=391922 RepID=A0A7W6S2J5_9PROT|nr:LysE family transporter [Roseospira goensis]MBB4287546.1 threonine/homoserine/homoserine lactone efflux protein [Roseospira goensis]